MPPRCLVRRHHLPSPWLPTVMGIAMTLAAAGCQLPLATNWLELSQPLGTQSPADSIRDLPATASPLQTTPLELTFVRYATDDPDLGETLWNLVDEQCLPADLRHRLARNGLRVGMIRGLLPPELAQRLAPAADEPAAEAADSPLATDRAVIRRVVQTLTGRPNEIVATPRVEELVLLECDSRTDAETLSGQTYRAASAVLDVRVAAAADGGANLKLVPLIRHGPVERTWIGDDGAFRLEAGQQRTVLDRLEVELRLPADGTLIISCAGAPASSVGDAFFRDPRGRHDGSRLLAIRLLARTTDPMFAAGG